MGILHDTEPLGPAMTETMLDPKTSLLVAQVKQAHASHRMDLSNKLLRSKHFNAPHKVVYLGDVATTLLAQLPHPETPEMEEAPGFNEQKWALVTQSGDITVHISSRSYWALGLFNSGYINIITLSGPLHERARIVFDTMSALGHKPWEFSHQNSAEKWFKKSGIHTSSKENERSWLAHRQRAKDDLNGEIERLQNRCEGVFQLLEGDDEANLRIEIDHDIHMANEALRDENAPAIERALARIEAALIAADPRSMPEMIAAPAEIIASGEDFLTIDERETSGELARIAPNQNDLDDVPFVDLTASESEEE